MDYQKVHDEILDKGMSLFHFPEKNSKHDVSRNMSLSISILKW